MIFFFNDTATTEIYTLSLPDALPIWPEEVTEDHRLRGLLAEARRSGVATVLGLGRLDSDSVRELVTRSEEHTSELQSRQYLVCRLLLEKKNMIRKRFRIVEDISLDIN